MTPCRDAEQMPPPLNLTNIEYSKYEIGCSSIQYYISLDEVRHQPPIGGEG